MSRSLVCAAVVATALPVVAACAGSDADDVLTFSGSAVGEEARVLEAQLDRFMRENPGVRVEIRATPDAADQRHQLYVQWLNAHAKEPDVLQLDVIWTPEFAAAGWLLPIDTMVVSVAGFFPATVEANRWRRTLFAVPWFVDVGMLYWRTDLMDRPPATFDELERIARDRSRDGARYGFVWQGARYEGLVTTFLEYLGGHGGSILDAAGDVTVDRPAAVHALTTMVEHIDDIVPRAALSWQEEQTRFAFQNGDAVFMRNWPYAYALLSDSLRSEVAGRFAVAPMPAASAGTSTAALGGAQLAINANSRQPREAAALIEFLTRPEQMLERARIAGQFPARAALYETAELAELLAIPPASANRVIEQAVPRPVTPVYTELSQILQIHLHRALAGQETPEAALEAAAGAMRALLDRVGLGPDESRR